MQTLASMAPPLSLPELNDDLMAEILIHVGPDEPACLFRASLTCKRWHRILSNPGFLRRYRAFHRCPPRLLGFFYNLDFPGPFSRFVATTPEAFTLPLRGFNDRRVSWALDCCHGRVLFKKTGSRGLVVWDPVADVWTDVPPPGVWYASYSAVVLCDVAGCDHRGYCGGGRFLVVCIGCDADAIFAAVRVSVYSSEDGAWAAPVSDGTRCRSFDVKRPAVIGDGIYCIVGRGARILKYDLVEHRFSWIDMPYRYRRNPDPVLLENEDGSLGLAGVRGSTLYLWSRTWDAEGGVAGGWVQWMVIKLRKMLPDVHDKPCIRANVIGFAEGVGVFFIRTDVGIFTVELNSGRVLKLIGPSSNYRTTFPLISSFTPEPDRA